MPRYVAYLEYRFLKIKWEHRRLVPFVFFILVFEINLYEGDNENDRNYRNDDDDDEDQDADTDDDNDDDDYDDNRNNDEDNIKVN